MNEHLFEHQGQTADLCPGLEDTLDRASSSHSLAPSKSSSALSAKLRQHKSKVVSALKALTNSSSEQVVHIEQATTSPKGQKAKAVIVSGIHKMSNAIFRPPLEPTVVRRPSPKPRPLLRETFEAGGGAIPGLASPTSPGGTTDSNTYSSKTGTSITSSTRITKAPGSPSLGSTFKPKDPNTVGREPRRYPNLSPRHSRRSPGGAASVNPPSSPSSTLDSIPETPTPTAPPSDSVTAPGIATVERAAAAKIFLETHFNQLLTSGPSPRQMRRQVLETELFNRARERGVPLGPAETRAARNGFYRRESEYLRESRVVKARNLGFLAAAPRWEGQGERDKGGRMGPVGDYETVKILGKGSFGVVKLVRDYRRGAVYAMKVIRKCRMLKTSQEGHLRAERDILVASEGSRWIVPLVASFQDITSLYLVMEYMPGGDFLSLLIRENILHESVARFYIAEIILCVEAAHSLKCIHRDIKPDNFLVSASGHLKISDFGLALVKKLGIGVDGDEEDQQGEAVGGFETKKRASGITAGIEKHDKKDLHDGEPLLSWRNRCGTRRSARSIVGTSQYMAPEVIEGRRYDARCDWWSVGVILFECIYGHTPFLSEEGRQQTKENILRHHETFGFPPRPTVSRRCQHLMLSLITDREYRLCSERYRMKDLVTSTTAPGSSSSSRAAGSSSRMHDFAGRYVFPYDAEDIKAHKWFRNTPWERLHELEPPLVPKLRSVDDTRYFDDGGSVSGPSESEDEDWDDAVAAVVADAHDGAAERAPETLAVAILAAPPHDAEGKLRALGAWLAQQSQLLIGGSDGMGAPPHEAERAHLREFIRRYAPPSPTGMVTPMTTPGGVTPNANAGGGGGVGRRAREKRRPRDKLLRDTGTRRVVMEVRRRTAFLGYEWTRMG
ncbi:AGC/NDR protein kinase, partial [Staphylotrichum tortipilum]